MARSRFYNHSDPFTFMVETIDKNDKAIDVLAGADNIYAARAAFKSLVESYRPNVCLLLRHGGRILVRSNGEAGNVVPIRPE